MKKLAALLPAGGLLLVLAVTMRAEETIPSAPTAASRVKIYGWVQSGITVNSERPDDRQNFGRLFDDRANELLLNQAVITAEQTLDPKPGQFDWGFKLQGMAGSDARFIHSLGLLDNASNTTVQPDIVEAFLNLHFAGLTDGGLDVKLGKFVTLEGAETIDPRAMVFYSHTYIFNFGIPFNHTGALATLHANKQFDLIFGVTRGVNTSIDDNNSAAAFHGGIGFNFGKVVGSFSTHFGPETPNNNKDYRYLHDLTFTCALSDKQSLIVDLNHINDDAANAKGYGAAVYYTQTLSDSVSIGLRGELWRDADGFYVAQFAGKDDVSNGLRGLAITDPRTVGGGPTTYGAITLGARITVPVSKPFAGLLLRPELRYDWSTKTNAFVDSTKKSQFTIGLDAILTF